MHQIDSFDKHYREYLMHQIGDFDENLLEHLMHQTTNEQINNKQISDK